MTEQQKQAALDMIAKRIATADHYGLRATAQSWRDLYVNFASRPAASILAPSYGTLTKSNEGN
jgi:hypothetical protein